MLLGIYISYDSYWSIFSNPVTPFIIGAVIIATVAVGVIIYTKKRNKKSYIHLTKRLTR